MHVYPIIIQPLAFTAYFILILLPVTGSVGENQGRKIHSEGGKVPFFFFFPCMNICVAVLQQKHYFAH